MPKIHDVFQGEDEWFQLRVGRVTASDFDRLVTTDFKVRDGATPYTYLCEKIAEAYKGKPMAGITSWATEQGQILEDEARGWYAMEYDDMKIRNVGFVEHDNGRCGCSPDALLGMDGGLEIKCPQPTNHVRYLLDGILPKDYAPQVHFSIYVTGAKWWRFVSYHRGYPALVLRVERDETIMAKIDAALAAFYLRYDEAMLSLKNKPNQ